MTCPDVCDCPFCPLQNDKVNVCNVRFTFMNEGKYRCHIPDGYEQYRENFLHIILHAKNNLKLKPNQELTSKRGKMLYTVDCISRKFYKLCVHYDDDDDDIDYTSLYAPGREVNVKTSFD